jgi:hypothetical protein
LRVEYNLVDGGWGGCEVIWPQVRDWSDAGGISLWLHADAAAQPVNVVLYAGNPEGPTPFVASVETTDQTVSGWTQLALPWTGLERADWADAGGLSSLDPAQVVGLGISVGSGQGTLWLDDVTLLSGEVQGATLTATLAPATTAAVSEATATRTAIKPTATPEPAEPVTSEVPKKSLCRAAGLPLLAILAAWLLRRQYA